MKQYDHYNNVQEYLLEFAKEYVNPDENPIAFLKTCLEHKEFCGAGYEPFTTTDIRDFFFANRLNDEIEDYFYKKYGKNYLTILAKNKEVCNLDSLLQYIVETYILHVISTL